MHSDPNTCKNRKAIKPIDSDAAAKADEVQPVCKTHPERKLWLDAYIEAGGLWRCACPSNRKPEETRKRCPNSSWVEFQYYCCEAAQNNQECNCPEKHVKRVGNLEYVAQFSDGSEQKGQLDAYGFCRIEGIPPGNVNVEYGDPKDDPEYLRLKQKLKKELNAVIEQADLETKRMEEVMAQESTGIQVLIYTGAFLSGAWDGAKGTAELVWFVGKAAYRLHEAYIAVITGNVEKVKGDLEALSSVTGATVQQLELFFDNVQIIYEADDEELKSLLFDFPKRYLKALHTTQWAEVGGAAAFEILFSCLTAGAGAAVAGLKTGGKAAVAAKAGGNFTNMLSRVRKAVAEILDHIEHRRKWLLRKKKSGPTETKIDVNGKPRKGLRPKAGFPAAKAPTARGILPKHDRGLSQIAKEENLIIIVRNSNPDAVNYLGKPGFKAKPMTMKPKTRKTPPNSGLVAVDPADDYFKSLMKKEGVTTPEAWVKKTMEPPPGWTVDRNNGFVLRDPQGNAYYSDVDLHGVYRADSGKSAWKEGMEKEISKSIDPDVELVQHGPHDEWLGRLDKSNGKNYGPQGDSTAYLPDGTRVHLETIEDQAAFYRKHGIDWNSLYPDQANL